MDYEAAVIDFLSQEENLPFILELSEKVGQVKDKLHQKFWKKVETKLKERLNESSLKIDWRLILDDDIFSSWKGISLSPITKSKYLYVYPKLEQWSGDLRLFYGIHWSQQIETSITIQLINDFLQVLKDTGYIIGKSSWWPAYQLTDIRPKSNDFLLRISKNIDSHVNNIIDIFWEFFSDNAEMMKNINQAIASNERCP